MFEEVQQALASLRAVDLTTISPADRALGIKALTAISNAAIAERARWIEAFDRERLYATTGDSSTTSWLRNNCQMSGGSAASQVELARQLPALEETRRALDAGEIGIEHAVEIARATKELGVSAEGELLTAARAKDPAELREAAREIRHRVDPDAMRRLAEEHYRRRRLRVFNLQDGMVGVDGALPPDGGVALKLCLESLAGMLAKDDDRTPEQRNADALMLLCKHELDSGRLPSKGGRKPHLMVVMQGEEAPRLEGYGPICKETAERLACGGSVSVLTVDKQGVALDLGRSQRLASEAQRRVLAARDKRCQHRSCTLPARFCEVHHLDFWVRDRGRTTVKRMVLLCDRHHRLAHEGGVTYEPRAG